MLFTFTTSFRTSIPFDGKDTLIESSHRKYFKTLSLKSYIDIATTSVGNIVVPTNQSVLSCCTVININA